MSVLEMKPPREFPVYTTRWLLKQKFPDTKWIVDSLLPEGLTLLVSAPKIGKSWIMLALACSVGFERGEAFGRYKTDHGDVLYMDLEQPAKRTQRRVQSTLRTWGEDLPTRLEFANAWPKIKDGGIEHLGQWLKMRPETRLVVIDTVAKIWPDAVGGKGQNAYYAEYDQLSQLKRIADDAGISIVLLHHQNKTADRIDKIDRISGSAAFAGVADCIWLLERERDKPTATLYVTGREVEERTLQLSFDPTLLAWTVSNDPLRDERHRDDGRYR